MTRWCTGINDIQELSMTHKVVPRAKTDVLHRIQTHHPPLHLPKAEHFLNSTRGAWRFAVLDRFPVPATITVLGQEALVEAACDVVGREVSEACPLGNIYEMARVSIAQPIAPDAPAIAMFRLVLAEARHPIRQHDAIEHMAGEILGGNAGCRRLQQIFCIRPVNALTTMPRRVTCAASDTIDSS